MKRKYSNNPDVFCYICESFTLTTQRQSINDFVQRAYFAVSSLGMKIKHRFHIKSVQTVWKLWDHGSMEKLSTFLLPLQWS